jgi:hypothetical protein
MRRRWLVLVAALEISTPIALLCRGNIGDVASDRSSLAATAA